MIEQVFIDEGIIPFQAVLSIDQNSNRTGLSIFKFAESDTSICDAELIFECAVSRSKGMDGDQFRLELEQYMRGLITKYNVWHVTYEKPYQNDKVDFERLKMVVNMETVIKDLRLRYFSWLPVTPIDNGAWKSVLAKLVKRKMPKISKYQKEFIREAVIELFEGSLPVMVEDCYDSIGVFIGWVTKKHQSFKPVTFKHSITEQPMYTCVDAWPGVSWEAAAKELLQDADTMSIAYPTILRGFNTQCAIYGIAVHEGLYLNVKVKKRG